MLTFRDLRLEDRDAVAPCLLANSDRNSDYCFSNMLLWGPQFHLQAAFTQGCMITRFLYEREAVFSYPIGPGDRLAAVEELLAHCRTLDLRPCIGCLSQETAAELTAAYPDRFSLHHQREYDDYLYTVEKLSELKGKKLHAKRNYVNRFLAAHPEWSYEPITRANMEECRRMDQRWMEESRRERQENFDDELQPLELMFTHYGHLGLEGGLLRLEGEVIAFTVGERLSPDTWVTHFEKAYVHIDGAYAMINREYARHIAQAHPEILYINREDDMGLENLRKAKESYYPDRMAEKYTATLLAP